MDVNDIQTELTVNYIRCAMPETELLAGLAEEASELAQAALKLRRAMDGTNPTPITAREAVKSLSEEAADVKLYLDVLRMNWENINEIEAFKMERWKSRLMEKEQA